MSTGCTRGQQNDDDDNDENNHHVLTAAAATTPQRLRRRRRHAGATTTATLPWAALVLFLLPPGRGAAEGFESYSGWSSRSRQARSTYPCLALIYLGSLSSSPITKSDRHGMLERGEEGSA